MSEHSNDSSHENVLPRAGKPAFVELHVSHHRDPRSEETLVFAPTLIDVDEARPAATYHTMDPQEVQRAIQNLQNKVQTLLGLASGGESRGDVGVEDESRELAEAVLPPDGFSAILPPGIQPVFDSLVDIADSIPWEATEESYVVCANPECDSNRQTRRLAPGQAAVKSCPTCGKPVSQGGGKLVLERMLSHVVRGGKSSRRRGGERFLFIEDPRGDLLRADDPNDPNAPANQRRQHLERLVALVGEAGYVPIRMIGASANARNVVQAIQQPDVVGMYYYGHGHFPKNERQGYLLLANNETLSANQIQKVNPCIPFVFLNACEAAAIAGNWEVGEKSQSVGSAFGRGGNVVIAPLWPVVGVQAAEVAVEFFQQVFAGRSWGTALQEIRRRSHERYAKGEADISWMAYRLFGQPDRTLPPPAPIVQMPQGPVVPHSKPRVFAEDDSLDTGLFEFPIDRVLFRAAKRKHYHGRPVVGLTDLLAGLFRCGGLTRYALRHRKVDPDDLCEAIIEPSNDETGGQKECKSDREELVDEMTSIFGDEEGKDEEEIAELWNQLLERFVVRERAEFDEAVVEVLQQADAQAQACSEGKGEARITERDVLDALLATAWPPLQGVPAREEIKESLEYIQRERRVDQNGALVLEGLDRDARRVIDSVHELAQQRGMRPIPNRLTMAAFFVDPEGFATRLMDQTRQKASAKDMRDVLIAATKGVGSDSFLLTPEACHGVVEDMLRKAQQWAGAKNAVNEPLLFAAFCDVASPNLKKAVASAWKLDLQALGQVANDWVRRSRIAALRPEQWTAPRIRRGMSPASTVSSKEYGDTNGGSSIDQSQFDEPAWQLIIAAGRWALRQGSTEIASPHLFAAMLDSHLPALTTVIDEAGFSETQYRQRILEIRRRHIADGNEVTLSPHTFEVLRNAVEIAGSEDRSLASRDDILRAFVRDGGGVVGELLKADGVQAPDVS